MQSTRRSARIQKMKAPQATTSTDTVKDSKRENDKLQPEAKNTASRSTQSKAKKQAINNMKEASTSDQVVIIARPDPRHVKGRRGFLRYMNEMPLDVVYEVFGQLEPVDLLHLSWACKSLQEILMGRKARFLWRNAFKVLCSQRGSPPPCPADLNFAQYARFLYDTRCMYEVCQIAIANYFSWGLRLNACENCLTSNHFKMEHMFKYPIRRIFHGVQTGYLDFYLNGARENMKYADYEKNLESLTKEFLQKKEGEYRYKLWRAKLLSEKKKELDRIRETRQKEILENLSKLGWPKTDIVKYMRHEPLGELPTFNKTCKLTKGDWAKICPKIISHLEKRKKEWNRKRIFENAYSIIAAIKRWTPSSVAGFQFKARESEFLVHEPFASFIFNNEKRGPRYILDEDKVNILSTINAECLQKRNETLFSLLSDDLKNISRGMNNPYEVLRLATIWFQITGFEGSFLAMDYTTTLQNATNFNRYNNRKDDPEVVKQLTQYIEGYRPWELDSSRFIFHHKAHEVSRQLLLAWDGKDPNTTTAEDMFADKTDIYCMLCKKIKLETRSKWYDAVTHVLRCHDECVTWDGSIWNGVFRVNV